jgi:hypothetical protein
MSHADAASAHHLRGDSGQRCRHYRQPYRRALASSNYAGSDVINGSFAVRLGAVGNVSVVNSAGVGFLTLFPGNLTSAPLVATSNYPAPATFGYNRHYFVALSPTDGTFKILTQFTTDVIVDVSGYFAP